jgi:chorismate synthase
VAAGAIAEKWLRQEYDTEVVAFVSSIGTVDMPDEFMHHPSGQCCSYSAPRTDQY